MGNPNLGFVFKCGRNVVLCGVSISVGIRDGGIIYVVIYREGERDLGWGGVGWDVGCGSGI